MCITFRTDARKRSMDEGTGCTSAWPFFARMGLSDALDFTDFVLWDTPGDFGRGSGRVGDCG
jgi:hypothetical protein